jgi:hypothetical protein
MRLEKMTYIEQFSKLIDPVPLEKLAVECHFMY